MNTNRRHPTKLSGDTVMSNCVCGETLGGHRPMEAYHGEEKLEGRKSSSSAKRRGCTGYRPAGLTINNLMSLYFCSGRWAMARKEAAAKAKAAAAER